MTAVTITGSSIFLMLLVVLTVKRWWYISNQWITPYTFVSNVHFRNTKMIHLKYEKTYIYISYWISSNIFTIYCKLYREMSPKHHGHKLDQTSPNYMMPPRYLHIRHPLLCDMITTNESEYQTINPQDRQGTHIGTIVILSAMVRSLCNNVYAVRIY